MKRAFLTAYLCSALFSSGAPLKIDRLQVDFQTNPTGVGEVPNLSWTLASDERGQIQRGFHLLAASSLEKLTEKEADLWNSRVENSNKRHLHAWQGKKLTPAQKVYWKVRAWDKANTPGDWSEPAHFVVGGTDPKPKVLRISHFESSSEELNQLYTESISRLEKRINAFSATSPAALGTGAEVHRSARAMLYHFEATSQLNEWLRLMDASLTKDDFFPILPGSEEVASISSEAPIIVHHPVWWMGADFQSPQDRWGLYEKHMIARENMDRAFKGSKWGTLADTEGTTAEFLDLCYLGFTTRLVRELAIPANQPLNVIRFQDYAARMKKSFQRQYIDDKGALKMTSQTAMALALRSAVLTPEQQQQVTADLVKSVTSEGLKVGPIGAYFLPTVLSLTNNQETAVKILTTLKDEQKTLFAENGISEWLMAFVAGIDTSTPGFLQPLIAPRIPSDDSITWVKAHYDSHAGKIEVHWQKLAEGGLKVDVSVPPGAIGRFTLPITKGQTVTESGKNIADALMIEVLSQSDTTVNLITQSGRFSLLIK